MGGYSRSHTIMLVGLLIMEMSAAIVHQDKSGVVSGFCLTVDKVSKEGERGLTYSIMLFIS